MPDIIHPEISYAVQGMFMTIHNKHGPMLHEEIYESLVTHLMQKAGYPCQRQQEFYVLYKDAHLATGAVGRTTWIGFGGRSEPCSNGRLQCSKPKHPLPHRCHRLREGQLLGRLSPLLPRG